MKKAASNGPEQNLNAITVLRVATRSSEVHNAAEPVKNRLPMNWMALFSEYSTLNDCEPLAFDETDLLKVYYVW